LPAVGLGVSVSALIARHVGLLQDAEEGASRVLKHNEVVSGTIPPGISCSPAPFNVDSARIRLLQEILAKCGEVGGFP